MKLKSKLRFSVRIVDVSKMLACFVVCTLCFSAMFTAIAKENVDGFKSLPVNSNDDIYNLINNEVGTDKLSQVLAFDFSISDKRYVPDDYSVDFTKYILEYPVDTEFWTSADCTLDGIQSKIVTDPVVYIPVFSELQTENGNDKRVVGHIKLKYNLTDKAYSSSVSFMNAANEFFLNRESMHFYEMITDYLENGDLCPDNVILLSYPNSFNDYSEKVAVIVNGDNIRMLDVGNSCHSEDYPKTVADYSLTDYKQKRVELENELYGHIIDREHAVFGGNSGKVSAKQKFSPKLTVIILLSVVCVGIIAVIVYKKKASLTPHRR